jgi:uncharacterized protein
MQIKRFKDIVAVKHDADFGQTHTITAFHASNMEVAELSPESFDEMSEISILSGLIPEESEIIDLESRLALDQWNSEINPNVKSGKIDNVIKSVSINVNQICNLKCAYCAAGGDGTYGTPTTQISVEKTLPQLKFFISKLKPGNRFSVSFIGGEPLLHPIAVKAIYDFISSECAIANVVPNLKIVTNGTLLEGKTLEIVKSMKVDLTISFDAVKEVNDKIRPSKNGSSTTDKIVDALRELSRDRGQIQGIHFSAITCQGNENIFENYIFLKSFHPDSIDFVFANDEKSSKVLKNHIEGLNKIINHAWSAGGEKELRKIKIIDHYFRMLDNQQQSENFCGAGKSYLMIDSKNQLYSCVWDANYSAEKIGQNTNIDQTKIDKLLKPLIDLNNCRTCWARHLCGGGCMHINRSHTGDKHKKSEMFCERTRNLILTTIVYYKLARSSN